jgi:hypothetical protein
MIGKQTYEQDKIVAELIDKARGNNPNQIRVGYLVSAMPSGDMYARMSFNYGSTAYTECLILSHVESSLVVANIGKSFLVANIGGVNFVMGQVKQV